MDMDAPIQERTRVRLFFDFHAAALKLACVLSLLRYSGNKGKSKFAPAISPGSRD